MVCSFRLVAWCLFILFNDALNTFYVLRNAGPNWEQFRSSQVPSELAPRSVELGVGPSLEPPIGPIGLRPSLVVNAYCMPNVCCGLKQLPIIISTQRNNCFFFVCFFLD